MAGKIYNINLQISSYNCRPVDIHLYTAIKFIKRLNYLLNSVRSYNIVLCRIVLFHMALIVLFTF